MNRRTWLGAILGVGALGGLQGFDPAPASADAFGAEAILLTYHVQDQRDAPVEEYKRRLDDRGQWVFTPGIEVYYDWRFAEPLWKARGIRATAGWVRDSVDHLFGYVAVMGRWMLDDVEPLTVSLQAGPGFIYRESWRDVPGYDPDNPLEESDDFLPGYEYKFLPLGEIDFLYRFTPGVQGVWSIFPGFPFVIIQNLGLRWSW
ncbi:MAG: hypothetical protein IIA41_03735 [SAR324 cluster bacterium]|nr:hypothetical protein [SAR324 cluster bacterium]